jgi:hypothetical protein
MQGTLSQIGLNDILLLVTEGKKTGLLKLSRGKEVVEIYLNRGEIVHAVCPIGEGEKALLYPVTWNDGTFALVSNGTPPGQTIQKRPAELLAEVRAMSEEWERILKVIPNVKTVFRLADLPEDHNGPVTIPQAGWRILCKIDGHRDVQTIAEMLRLPYAYTAKAIYKLHEAGLVEAVASTESAQDVVSPSFWSHLTRTLAEAIGPMASLIVRDQLAALGESQEKFPRARLKELMESLLAEVQDPSVKNRLRQEIARESGANRDF